MAILVTGGAGYIGSHACVALSECGHDLVVVDDFSNSYPQAIDAVAEISGRRPLLLTGDVADAALLDRIFAEHPIEAVIHFAGLKAVGESVTDPLRYYAVNIGSTLALCGAMARAGVRRLVFSSSATVYGDPASVPIDETAATGATNPYGRTKLFIEHILRDLAATDPEWAISLLRYFNPVGAHPSGLIGEDPQGIPNNLLPFISKVAIGQLPELSVFGSDWPTPDGTGVRDFIHVMDLVEGHVAALRFITGNPGLHVHNLGTGNGHSVLDMVRAFERASGRPVPYRFSARRPGDVAAVWANPERAWLDLGWRATRDLDTMCRDAWNWQSRNPHGFRQ